MKKLRDAVLVKVAEFDKLRSDFVKLGSESKTFLKESTQSEIRNSFKSNHAHLIELLDKDLEIWKAKLKK